MKTSSETTTKIINSDLKEAFALWEKKKGDKVYYSGKTAGNKPVNIVAFINTVKKNPNQPDINIYESKDKGEERVELASLWQHKSKAGKLYYSGYTNEKENLLAFINGNTQDGKYPSIRVYYKEDEQ